MAPHGDHPDLERNPTKAGTALPALNSALPGPRSAALQARAALRSAPMGPTPSAGESPPSIVYESARGANVFDVDGNRFVDLAAGFGALLLGHAHPSVVDATREQLGQLTQALGDVYPSRTKIALAEKLGSMLPELVEPRVIFGQSGADAVTAALKTAALATGRPGVIAFKGAYHGLSYAPLATCGLRESYRAPFAKQLNQHVTWLDYPRNDADAERVFEAVIRCADRATVGAVLCEPIAGRAGVIEPPPRFLASLPAITERIGALLIIDEIWTGLGRAGTLLVSRAQGCIPDLLCLGKGLGGGLPISACVGSSRVMQHWRQPQEVTHTSTFAGAPLACRAALATLEVIEREALVERANDLGNQWRQQLRNIMSKRAAIHEVRGRGLMLAIDLGPNPGRAQTLQGALLERGFITSTGGGAREVLILTPPLTVALSQLEAFNQALAEVLQEPT